MPEHYYVARRVPERFVEVDAARLLLIITRFAQQVSTPPSLNTAKSSSLQSFPCLCWVLRCRILFAKA